jgi:hypothetical protein
VAFTCYLDSCCICSDGRAPRRSQVATQRPGMQTRRSRARRQGGHRGRGRGSGSGRHAVWCLIDADVHVTLEKPSVYVPVRRTTAAPPPACRRPDARSDWQQPLMLLAPTARERDVVHPPRPVPTPRAHRRSTMDVDGGRRRRRATGTPGRAATGRVGVRVPCSRPVEDHRRFAVVEPPSNGFLAGTAVALGGRAGRHRRAKMMAAGTRCPPRRAPTRPRAPPSPPPPPPPAAWRCPLAWTPDGLHCSARNHDKPTCTGLDGCESECDASVTTTGRAAGVEHDHRRRASTLTMFFRRLELERNRAADVPAMPCQPMIAVAGRRIDYGGEC